MSIESVPTKLYSRYEDGFQAIHMNASGDGHSTFLVQADGGGVTEYPTARQLLIGLTGHPTARHWTFDRYFRQGKYRPWDLRVADLPQNQPSLNFLDLPFENLITAIGVPELLLGSKSGSPVGIDLVKRGHEVAKLFYAGFAGKLIGAGLDPDDVLQEVYRGILIRNRGKCPWDGRKSSFGHYVHMVASCVISNYFRHENRKNSIEQTGIHGRVAGADGFATVDVASDEALVGAHPLVSGGGEDEVALHDLLKFVGRHGGSEAKAHPEVLLLMREGYNRIEVARRLELPTLTVSRLFNTFQGLVLKWDSHSA